MNSDTLKQTRYKNIRLSLLAVLINASFLIYLLYPHNHSITLIGWYILHLLVTLARYLTLVIFEKNTNRFSSQKWEEFFTIGIVVSAFMWGVTPLLFFNSQNILDQMVIIVIIAGMTAGAVSTLSQSLRNIWLYLAFSISPLILALILQENQTHLSIALLVTLYMLLLMNVSKKLNITYLDAVNSKKEFEEKTEELLLSEQQFESVFKNAPVGIMLYDANFIIKEVNEEFVTFLNAPREFLIGLDLRKMPDKSFFSALETALNGDEGFYEGTYTTMYHDLDLYLNLSASPIKDKNGVITSALAIITDITQRVYTQKQLEHQANYDSLTDIPNRAALLKSINKEIARYHRHGNIFGVIFMDLDHFKNINDSLGHAFGDQMLIITAQRIQSALRQEDSVARIGGDEFVILVSDLGSDPYHAATEIEQVAKKIHEALSEPYLIQTYNLNVSSSLGIVLISEDIITQDDILKHADIAMYQAKKEGRNTTRFYQSEMDSWIKRRLEVENELRNAIKNGELTLHYQPIVNIKNANIVGAEALLRWNSQKLGAVFPDEFIPIAEESGLIISIGTWVLENAMSQFMLWKKEFAHLHNLTKIAINVSVHQFNSENFLKLVENFIVKTQIPPECLELELTESIIAKDIANVKNKMLALRSLGVSLSIDDFGTGYSSLSYLKKLPFSTLKIDKSFTSEIHNTMDEKDLIATILTIAKNFHLDVVVEGVEELEQYLYVLQKDATYLQGYYCSKPMDAEAFTAMLVSNNGSCSILLKQGSSLKD